MNEDDDSGNHCDGGQYDIDVVHHCGCGLVDAELLRRAVACTLSLHRQSAANISVALVDDDRIAEVNQAFLQHEGPTDVISFCLSDNTCDLSDTKVDDTKIDDSEVDDGDIDDAEIDGAAVDDGEIDDAEIDGAGGGDAEGGDAEVAPLEGELIISIDTATREAKSRGHDVLAEVSLYAVHGTLHLLGFDDLTPEDARIMRAREDDVLRELGFGSVYSSHASDGSGEG